MKADPDGFRWVWISFFAACTIGVGLGVASEFVGHSGLLLGVSFVIMPVLVLGSLSGYARRVQRRLDRERAGP